MKKILITAPVHQDVKIFKEYLWSLNRLEIPEGYEVYKYFYLHNAGNLKKFLQPNEYEVFNDNTKVEESDITHIWKMENFKVVSQMRTKALEKARKEEYDYLFTVDSDIILHKNTLINLLETQKKFISQTYWTVWNIEQPDLSMPNWYDGRTQNGLLAYTEEYTNYIDKKTIRPVGITCGPSLISKEIFNNKYINYYPIKNLSFSYWEDYAFCIRCKNILPDLKIFTYTGFPARHLYRKEDYEKWMNEEKAQWKKEF